MEKECLTTKFLKKFIWLFYFVQCHFHFVAAREFCSIKIAELKSVRLSAKALFESFNKEDLQITSRSGNSEMQVLAIGFTLLKHQIHHLKILENKYYPLVGAH